jgi:hypothetical protein
VDGLRAVSRGCQSVNRGWSDSGTVLQTAVIRIELNRHFIRRGPGELLPARDELCATPLGWGGAEDPAPPVAFGRD